MTPLTAALTPLSPLNAAGGSDPGLARDVNEDRFFVDAPRGIFIVVDGVGGQAAGGKAADIALATLKSALTRDGGPLAVRMRDAITSANNEIHRTAALRAEWNGMACVLTAVVVGDGRATIGHVGDTRLYKLRAGSLQKVTRDHSPVGEREDQGEITEVEAMNHPRRHEVYRDVGSDAHHAADDDFVDVYEIAFEADAALLLCSDGLTDLVDSAAIRKVTSELAGQPSAVVKRLIEAANQAGGKDNVTVVYVEGERFTRRAGGADDPSEITRRRTTTPAAVEAERGADGDAAEETRDLRGERTSSRTSAWRIAIVLALTLLAGTGAVLSYPYWSARLAGVAVLPPSNSPTIVVRSTESISAALDRAESGSRIVVEPGEYRERLALKSGVMVMSRDARGATIRLPGGANDRDPAVVAAGVRDAALIGFRIVGDAATPLGTGVLATDSDVTIMDVEITGATNVAVDVRNRSHLNLVGSTIQSNPGAAISIGSGSTPRVAHNLFAQNGTSERVSAPLLFEPNAGGEFTGNVFHGWNRSAFAGLSDSLRDSLVQHNVFIDPPDLRSRPAAPPRPGRGR